ncbi:hypothetical protein RDWZM_008694 [Blomia tropicalis]|uniref:6-pyruvoyl tetrahydrobiopterin synthase n=1 Tax=Blomia tropicalis TaxID=40697 RepID=A0A9Q0M293_BLOTA|nr:hypothetical protein RDWZM_008694 [Blomia tropicalis]
MATTPLVYLTRAEHFCAAHRLCNTEWDQSKNRIIFGKCENIHGHNYRLKVTVKGSVDRSTGMVMNIADLSTIIERSVLSVFDHKFIEDDVPHFKNEPSTSENICLFIWNQIEPSLPSNVKLHRIKLNETNKNYAEYFGEMST